MGQQVLIRNLEETSKFSEQFLDNILNDQIYSKETEELYTKAKAKQELATSLFIDISETIERIEEAGKKLSKNEKTRVEDLLVKYNLMVLAYCLPRRESLELCCNNFFRCVIGDRVDYTEADTAFYLKLRCHALASAIKESNLESNFDEKYDKEEDIKNHLPCEAAKHYFYGGEVRTPLDLTLLVEAADLCDDYLENGTEKLENEFYREALNDDLISFVKSILDVIAKRSASYNGKGKRSEIPDQDESRSVKKTKTSIFDPTEDAREIEESEIFSLPSSPLPDISGGFSPNNSNIIDHSEANLYELEESDEDGVDFYDAPANLSEPNVSIKSKDIVERSYTDPSNENNSVVIENDSDEYNEYNESIEDNATSSRIENTEETQFEIQSREQSRNPFRQQPRKQSRELVREQSREPAREQSREPAREQSREPAREQSREPAREQSREPAREQSREQSIVSEVSENRARDNDSDYSPGEQDTYSATTDPSTSNGKFAYHYADPNQKREPVRDRKPGSKQKLRAKPVPWTAEEVKALEDGLRSCKAPLWVKIIADASPKLRNRTNVQCKDKAKTELKKLERLGYTEKKDLGPYGYVKFPELDD